MSVFGVDLHPGYQASFNARQAHDEGVEFAFVKTSQGINYVPAGFHDYFARVEEGLGLAGFYHFLEKGATGTNQAEHFLDVIARNGGPRGRLLAVDFEDYGNRDPSNKQLLNFVRTVKNETGHPIIIYSTHSFWTGGDPSGPFDQYGADAAWEARVWTATERRKSPERFYLEHWLPWYEGLDDKGFGGIDSPLFRQYTWGASYGGLYVDADACTDADRLLRLAGA